MSEHWLGNETQAGRVIEKAGGPGKLSKLIKLHTGENRHRTCIYRWNWPKSKGGTGGLIPTSSLMLVVQALRRDGIAIENHELFPDLLPTRIIR